MSLAGSMNAMVLEAKGQPLKYKSLPLPVPAPEQVLINVIACGVCRTDLHIVDGELVHPKLPLIPGHEIVGRVVQTGHAVTGLKVGDWVGVPWLGYTCGRCMYCLKGQENLCEHAGFTGYTIDGGFAEYMVAAAQYCFHLPNQYANASGTPLMCAGLIGYRSYSMVPSQAKRIGIYGFGAAAHILIQVAVGQGKEIFAFTRKDDVSTQEFARQLGAVWAGGTHEPSPESLDAAIIFAPAGELIPKALYDTGKAGVVICGGIHMSDIPSFPYKLLWEERMIRSVANLTRKDGLEFLQLATQINIHTETQLFPLHKANEALESLRKGRIRGAAVLQIGKTG